MEVNFDCGVEWKSEARIVEVVMALMNWQVWHD